MSDCAGQGASAEPGGGEWDADSVKQYVRMHEGRQTPAVSAVEAMAALAIADVRPGAFVLDCPCGFGRHSAPLAAAGYHVAGLDKSQAMLAEARHREAADATSWLHADYRFLPFATGSFDAILNLYTSFGYYGDRDDRHVIAEFYRVLRPGGALVIETNHRDRLARSFSPARRRVGQNGAVFTTDSSFDLATGWLEMRHAEEGAKEATTSAIRVYSATELAAMLTQVNFREVEFFGSLDGSPLSLDSRLVAVARR